MVMESAKGVTTSSALHSDQNELHRSQSTLPKTCGVTLAITGMVAISSILWSSLTLHGRSIRSWHFLSNRYANSIWILPRITMPESKKRRKNRSGRKANKPSEKNSRTRTPLWRWSFPSRTLTFVIMSSNDESTSTLLKDTARKFTILFTESVTMPLHS